MQLSSTYSGAMMMMMMMDRGMGYMDKWMDG
jgi:hypothetical protein